MLKYQSDRPKNQGFIWTLCLPPLSTQCEGQNVFLRIFSDWNKKRNFELSFTLLFSYVHRERCDAAITCSFARFVTSKHLYFTFELWWLADLKLFAPLKCFICLRLPKMKWMKIPLSIERVSVVRRISQTQREVERRPVTSHLKRQVLNV